MIAYLDEYLRTRGELLYPPYPHAQSCWTQRVMVITKTKAKKYGLEIV
ncbi:MAG: hypothetical protein L7H05_02040 [Vulcanisaeta sp.]|nr:hypothetical protein [Vulcanisaeta sp.]